MSLTGMGFDAKRDFAPPTVFLQQYGNCELPDVQPELEKAEEPEIKLPTFL